MNTSFSKYVLAFIFLVATLAPQKCQAGLYEDVKDFVTKNASYNHGLTISVAIYSFVFLNTLIASKRFNVDPSAALVISFLGSYIASKLAKDYPGTTTLSCLGLGTLIYFDIINPKL